MTLINYILNSSAFRQFFYLHFANILSFGFQSVAREDDETVANLLKGLIDEASEISSSTQNDSKSETFK
jgi:hypothetical protein